MARALADEQRRRLCVVLQRAALRARLSRRPSRPPHGLLARRSHGLLKARLGGAGGRTSRAATRSCSTGSSYPKPSPSAFGCVRACIRSWLLLLVLCCCCCWRFRSRVRFLSRRLSTPNHPGATHTAFHKACHLPASHAPPPRAAPLPASMPHQLKDLSNHPATNEGRHPPQPASTARINSEL